MDLIENELSGACKEFKGCESDNDCESKKKCCKYCAFGAKRCVDTLGITHFFLFINLVDQEFIFSLINKFKLIAKENKKDEKPGKCPISSDDLFDDCESPIRDCEEDKNCKGVKKCCRYTLCPNSMTCQDPRGNN